MFWLLIASPAAPGGLFDIESTGDPLGVYTVTYNSPGNYTFRCMATDTDGLTDVGDVTITVGSYYSEYKVTSNVLKAFVRHRQIISLIVIGA